MPPVAALPSDQALDLAALRARLASVTGKQYWRSLEEAAQTPEFTELLAREFAAALPEPNDIAGRRDFLKLMAASLALAGITGCTRAPEEKIVPYVRAPEEFVPGKPLYYATAFTLGGYALGVLAESHMGRPTKIEGNPQHPASLGGTDAFAQASVLGLYDPDRSQTVMYRGRISTWDRFLTAISQQMQGLRDRGGQGLSILTETVTSPTLAAQIQSLRQELPELKWRQYEPFGRHSARQAAMAALGRPVDTIYHFDRADVILSLGSDFLLELPGSVRYARDFIGHRRVADGVAQMSRLYAAESTPSCTGAMADHRLRLPPRGILRLARALDARIGPSTGLTRTSEASLPGVPNEWLAALIADLEHARGRSLVVAGEAEPPEVHVLAHAINGALDNVGQTVQYIEPVEAEPLDQVQSLNELVDDMHNDRVKMLVMLGGNPIYNTPPELDFQAALKNVQSRVHLAEYYDETSFVCDWHVPAAHYLESWSDARAYDGTATILQPIIAPLYGGRTHHELVSALAGHPDRSSYQLVQEHWRRHLAEEDFSRAWRRAVHDGVVADTAAAEVDVAASRLLQEESREPDEAGLELIIRPDPSIHDGRFANNAWLQELPKPLTKITWDNALLLSPRTAELLGLADKQMAEVSVADRKLSAPVWIMPGHADGCATLTAGYGRAMAGRIGSHIGVNAYALRLARSEWSIPGALLLPTGESYAIAQTQTHHLMEGRDLVRVATHGSYLEDPHHFDHGHHEPVSLYGEPFTYDGYAWGMVIDQTACIGCNACVVACQAENNIPVVGKDQVEVGREMHWLRIDRYFQGPLDEPDIYFQPVTCMHCEQAPCEVVCPVAATVHSSEGLNEMVYNRCVGTRYCSNNCPYKVRRFNYLQYSDEKTLSLKLLNNPDVTVRSRGVMEKCTYCVQRINATRIEAKKQGRNIRDGEVVTACQAACPTRAIVFGDINDAQSEVRRLKDLPLNYGLLTELNTRPRTTYLARVTNPRPDLSADQARGKT